MNGSGLAPALLPNEQLLARVRQHVLLLLFPLLLLSVAFVAFVLVFCPTAHAHELNGSCLPIAGAAVLFAGLMVFLDWYFTIYTLTDRRLIWQQGFFGRLSMQIRLENVQDVAAQQDILGRIFNYGTIRIQSASTRGAVRWIGVAHPIQVRDTISLAVDLQRKAWLRLMSPSLL
jgi:uncharacterized membrane protein YdbT with pleckstrin-like domain